MACCCPSCIQVIRSLINSPWIQSYRCGWWDRFRPAEFDGAIVEMLTHSATARSVTCSGMRKHFDAPGLEGPDVAKAMTGKPRPVIYP